MTTGNTIGINPKQLFTPYRMKKLMIKNRFMRSAMDLSMATYDGFVTEDLVEVYKDAAQGGVGLFCTECLAIHPTGRISSRQMGIWSNEHIVGLSRLAHTIHAYGNGCVIWGQLGTEGAHQWGYSYGQQDAGVSVDTLEEEQINNFIAAFADCAARIQEAGLDGVHLHGGHGYLISQFLSPAINHRTDKWGGNLENRARFVLEIYNAVRQRVGEDFPFGLKMNTADFLHGGHWIKDTSRLAHMFSNAGFDLIEMSGGMGYMIELREALRKKVGPREYYFVDAIPAFRNAIQGTDTALATVGGIRTPSVMADLLEQGIDLISLGRPWLCEPHLANRIDAGDVRPAKCISGQQICNLCLTKLAKGSVQCVKFYPGDCRMTCPIDQNNPDYLSLMLESRMEEALEVIKRDNPLANTLSRVCHHPCENACRGKNGEPLALRDLKRYVTDYGLDHGYMLETQPRTAQNLNKVAVVGSGPAGLTCAFYLAQWGYRPVVFEKLSVLGGMPSWAIPTYRLPEQILKADIAYVESAGVEFITGITVGKDIAINDLFDKGYDAVFLALGASKSKSLKVEGNALPGVMQGLDFLRTAKEVKRPRVGKQVVVIGGGNVAVDAAMTAVRLGAPDTLIVCLESQNEMPAHREQLEEAMEEGVKILSGWGPLRIRGEKEVESLDLIKCLSVYDDNNLFNPTFDNSTTMTVAADTVIVAIGQMPDTHLFEKSGACRPALAAGGLISVLSSSLETNVPGVFAGGDVTTGPRSVVEAVAAGKTAAESITRYLEGRDQERHAPYRPYVKMTHPDAFAHSSDITFKESSERAVAPRSSPADRSRNFNEISKTLTADQAHAEAKRCMKYDLELESESAARLEQMGKAAFVLNPEDEIH